MKLDRRNGILGGVLVVLSLTYVAGLLSHRTPAAPVVVPSFKTSAADHITAGSSELRKRDAGGWQISIGGSWYPADSRKVEHLLSILSGLTAGREASGSEESWKTFRVDRANANPLTVEAGGSTIVDLLVGESSSAGGVYVRVGAAPSVYEVFANIDSYVSADSSFWSDLKILPRSLTVDSLQTIGVTAHGFSVGGTTVDADYMLESSVVGGKNAWVMSGNSGRMLDQKKVLSLEAEIVQMVGERFVPHPTSAETGLGEPTAVISISDEQGSSWSIEVGRRFGSEFYVRRSDRPYVYLVNEWTLHRAIPSLGDLTSS